MPSEPVDSEYFREIEAHFALRRGTPFILSAKDWGLMKKWHEEGIPLSIVIEAIDSVFEKNEASGRRKVISSLSYCRHAVKELWEERKDLQIGDEDELPEVELGAKLESLASQMPEGVAQFASRLLDLKKEKSIPRVEEALIGLEREIVDHLTAALEAEERSRLMAEAGAFGSKAKVSEATRRRTAEANLRRLVRERFGLPRLTLFH
ncbi:MAG TPA: hypothetical protein VFL80_02005 [Thermoanaerobaculia bacterium]|nr:hypothetical protein [Thermoanaerobaculia bacterium]